jgi:hypothetical protein
MKESSALHECSQMIAYTMLNKSIQLLAEGCLKNKDVRPISHRDVTNTPAGNTTLLNGS